MYDHERPYTVRIRIAHTFSERRGWKHEASVDLTGNANDPVDVDAQLEERLRRADDIARAESRRRNTIDGYDAGRTGQYVGVD